MPTVFTKNGYRFFFYVPVRKGCGEAVFEVEGGVVLRESFGLRTKQLRDAEDLASEHRAHIIENGMSTLIDTPISASHCEGEIGITMQSGRDRREDLEDDCGGRVYRVVWLSLDDVVRSGLEIAVVWSPDGNRRARWRWRGEEPEFSRADHSGGGEVLLPAISKRDLDRRWAPVLLIRGRLGEDSGVSWPKRRYTLWNSPD